jgi:hypothetical protein
MPRAKKVKVAQDQYCLIKYRYGKGAHFGEGQEENSIGIPNRKYVKGIRILRMADDGAQINALLYDTKSKKIRGVFESTGTTYESREDVFSADADAGDEAWTLRLRGLSMVVDEEKGIPIADFLQKFPEVNITKGSCQHIPQAAIEFGKECLRS